MAAIKPIAYQSLVQVFEHDGFTFDRQKGDHLIYTKPRVKRPIVIPMYSAVPVFIIKNMLITLEGRGLIERTPGLGRSIRLLIPREELPDLE